MIQIALRLFIIIEILFFIGAIFILYILKFKDIKGALRKPMWTKYAWYFLVINAFLLTIFLGEPYFYSLVFILIFLGLREFLQMLVIKEIDAYRNFGLLAGVGIFLSAIFKSTAFFYSSVLFSFVLVLVIPILKKSTKSSISNISSTFLGVLYVSFLLTHIVLIYKLNNGLYYVAFLFALLTMNDGFSELFGRSLGKTAIWPQISPNKTLAGSTGGLLSAVAGSLLFRFILPGLPIYFCILSGVIVGVSGQLGDLIASVLKRDANLKDFGDILPGHGGVLDRFDGLIFAAPVFYYFLIIIS